MAGFGQILGGALAGVGQGMVQMAQLQWQSALANQERLERRAERAEDREWRAKDREDEQQFRAEDRKAEQEYRAAERKAEQEWRTAESEKDRSARAAESAADRAARAADSAADRASRERIAREGNKEGGEDKRGKRMLDELKERYTFEEFDENSGKTIKRVDNARVKQAMFAAGYDSYGTPIPSAPASVDKRADGRLYRAPNGRVAQWTRQGWVEVYGGAGN